MTEQHNVRGCRRLLVTQGPPPPNRAPRAVSRVENQVAQDIGVKSRDFGIKSRDWTGNRETGKTGNIPK